MVSRISEPRGGCVSAVIGAGSERCVLASRSGEERIASASAMECGERDRNGLFQGHACLAGTARELQAGEGRSPIKSALRIANFCARMATHEAMQRTKMQRRTRTDADAARTASLGAARFAANSLLNWNAAEKNESPRPKSSRRTRTPAAIARPSAQLGSRSINPTIS